MNITPDTLRKIAAMPEQAMVVALTFLAEQLEAVEAKRNAAATRQKRYRLRHKDADVTSPLCDSNADVTPLARVEDNINNLTPLDLEKHTLSLSKPLPANLRATGSNPRALGTNPRAISQEPEDFAAFMAVYPRRAGAVDRKQALKAFAPALKRADLQTILHGARAYNAEMTAKGKVGTEYVKQARTWLNADGWAEYQAQTDTVPGKKRITVFEGSTAWNAWKATGKRFNATDIKDDNGRVIGRGWYFDTEYPEQEKVA